MLPALFILGEFTFIRLLLTSAGLTDGPPATVAGAGAALLCFVAHTAFQTRQFRDVFPPGGESGELRA